MNVQLHEYSVLNISIKKVYCTILVSECTKHLRGITDDNVRHLLTYACIIERGVFLKMAAGKCC